MIKFNLLPLLNSDSLSLLQLGLAQFTLARHVVFAPLHSTQRNESEQMRATFKRCASSALLAAASNEKLIFPVTQDLQFVALDCCVLLGPQRIARNTYCAVTTTQLRTQLRGNGFRCGNNSVWKQLHRSVQARARISMFFFPCHVAFIFSSFASSLPPRGSICLPTAPT